MHENQKTHLTDHLFQQSRSFTGYHMASEGYVCAYVRRKRGYLIAYNTSLVSHFQTIHLLVFPAD